jgi:5-hydroxyisourate hydrolase-like protein (transthyretin family)
MPGLTQPVDQITLRFEVILNNKHAHVPLLCSKKSNTQT